MGLYGAGLNETETKNATELIGFIGQAIGNKGRLIEEMKEQLGIGIPKKYTYRQILDSIINKGLEKKFCETFLLRLFGTDNFKDSYDKYVLLSGLTILDKNELTRLAERASNYRTKWKYDRRSRVNIVNDMLSQASYFEIESSLVEAMKDSDIGPLIRQSKRWIIGPLGVRGSVESRGAEVDEFVDILQKHLRDKDIDSFLEKDTLLKKEFVVKKDDPLRIMKFIQSELALRSLDDILRTFNNLVSEELIDITTQDTGTYFYFIVTPYGIFKKEYSGTEKLCQLILKEIDATSLEQAIGTRFKASSLELRVLDKCIRENPDDILQELFGRPQLLKIGRDLGLVKIEDLNNMDLARLIVMRLGFTFPPHLEGIALLIKKVTEGRKKIFNPMVGESTKRGIAVEALQGIEHVLKELAYFYVNFLWEKEVANLYGAEEIKTKISEIIKREFGMTRKGGLAKFTLGMLIDLMRNINSRIKMDSGLHQQVHRYFEKDHLISDIAINLVSDANTASPQIKHADEAGASLMTLDLASCDKFLTNIVDALNILKHEGNYPTLIRVREEITDEYGRRYIIAVDDEGDEWTIKTDAWLQPEKAYYMHSETSQVAVSPFIVEKIF